jgi:hypothetical protein
MPETVELIDLFVLPLAESSVPYMVTGSVASIVFGEMRFTRDIDVVLFVQRLQLAKVIGAFPENAYYCPPLEAIHDSMDAGRGMFNVLHPASGLKADFFVADGDELYSWAFAHRRIVQGFSRPLFFAPPEYVILSKLRFFADGHSDKHIRDIEGMLAVLGKNLDRAFLENTIAKRGLEDTWKLVNQTLP